MFVLRSRPPRGEGLRRDRGRPINHSDGNKILKKAGHGGRAACKRLCRLVEAFLLENTDVEMPGSDARPQINSPIYPTRSPGKRLRFSGETSFAEFPRRMEH